MSLTEAPAGPRAIAGPGPARRSAPGTGWLLGLPALLFLGAFFLYPLVLVLLSSVPGGSLANYARIAGSPLYGRVIAQTFQTSLIVTGLCLLLAYPYAFAMVRAGRIGFAVLAMCLLLPFWVSLLLRTFSWMVLLQDSGLINRALMALHITDSPVRLIRNRLSVVIGMTHILLPYAVLPIFAAMRKVDMRLMEAASICGAGPVRAFFRVFLPLTLPGVWAGGLLCFTLALGFYITPALLGSPRDTMIAQLVAAQVTELLNLSFGSALAAILLVITALIFALAGLAMQMKRRRAASEKRS
ncbi:ABC transporter permease [Pseudoxanthobacter sp.]|uniref:ABC transporter permease n=1 Tax=Pseudoxanthobacter sp. TaxID=1925742 RepID=UPI002FE1B212